MLLYAIFCRFIPKKMLAFAIIYRAGKNNMDKTCGQLFYELTEERQDG